MPAIEPPENGRFCRKHPSATVSGVCPSCLRGRLSLLCADCAKLRPCSCEPLSSASEHQSAQYPEAAAAAMSVAKDDSVVRSSSDRGGDRRDGWRRRWKCLNLQFSNPCRVFRRKKPAKVSW